MFKEPWQKNKKYRHFTEKYAANVSLLKQVARRIIKEEGIGQHELIADIGCGDGKIASELAEVKTRRVIGLGASRALIELAKSTYGRKHKNLIFIHGDMRKFNLLKYTNGKKFDKIRAYYSVQWITKNEFPLFLNCCKTQLKQNGILDIVLPNIDPRIAIEHAAIQAAKSDPRWADYFSTIKDPQTNWLPNELKGNLKKQSLEQGNITGEVVRYEFNNLSEFTKFVRSWCSAFNDLPKEKHDDFEKTIGEKYYKLLLNSSQLRDDVGMRKKMQEDGRVALYHNVTRARMHFSPQPQATTKFISVSRL